MTLAFQTMLMVVLLVSGSVAFIPLLLRDATPRPTPSFRASSLRQPGLWIVENGKGEWFVNGVPVSPDRLVQLLRGQGRQRIAHYLPSDALPLARVARSLRRLRTLTPGAVVLELPPAAPARP
jgi:hypothetical protein